MIDMEDDKLFQTKKVPPYPPVYEGPSDSTIIAPKPPSKNYLDKMKKARDNASNARQSK